MAAITSSIIAAGATAYSISQKEKARKQREEAQQKIENYDRQSLEDNAYEDIKISTLGADLAREEQARSTATVVDALQSAGTRGIGALGAVQASNNRNAREIAVGLDEQIIDKQYAMADDETRLRTMRERREELDLAGLGTLLDVSKKEEAQAMGNAVSAGMTFIEGLPELAQDLGIGQGGANGGDGLIGSFNDINDSEFATNWGTKDLNTGGVKV